MNIKDRLKSYFGTELRKAFMETEDKIFEECEEIRIRLGKRVVLKSGNGESFLKGGYKACKKDIRDMLELMSDYSPYSFEYELKNGFITLEGGFRVGMCGTAIMENGVIKGLKGINSVNIRICREVPGCSAAIMDKISRKGIKNTIILSPPACGKTTLLRDIIRNLSNRGTNIGVADERCEISGMYNGVCINDLGSHTDVYSCCTKSEGIMMLLRAMSPQVVCADEIWGENDCKAIESAAASGVNIICTAHAGDIGDLHKRADLNQIGNIFDLAVVLSRRKGPGTIENIYELQG